MTTIAVRLNPGNNFRGLTIVRLIAEGGMGLVYEVTHPFYRVHFALKVMRGEFCRNAEARELFRREVDACREMSNHPNSVHHAWSDAEDEQPFIVMELLEGATLEEYINANPDLSQELRVSILTQVTKAVAALHKLGYAHRDIKPSNIYLVKNLVGKDNWVRILDFGIVKPLHERDKPKNNLFTQARGVIRGTPQYMSPEQFDGDCTCASDVFCLGLVGSFILLGKHVFQPSDVPVARRERDQLQYVPLPFEEIASSHLRRVLVRACLFQADKRYTDAKVLGDALKELDQGPTENHAELKRGFQTVPLQEPPPRITAFEENAGVEAPSPGILTRTGTTVPVSTGTQPAAGMAVPAPVPPAPVTSLIPVGVNEAPPTPMAVPAPTPPAVDFSRLRPVTSPPTQEGKPTHYALGELPARIISILFTVMVAWALFSDHNTTERYPPPVRSESNTPIDVDAGTVIVDAGSDATPPDRPRSTRNRPPRPHRPRARPAPEPPPPAGIINVTRTSYEWEGDSFWNNLPWDERYRIVTAACNWVRENNPRPQEDPTYVRRCSRYY